MCSEYVLKIPLNFNRGLIQSNNFQESLILNKIVLIPMLMFGLS